MDTNTVIETADETTEEATVNPRLALAGVKLKVEPAYASNILRRTRGQIFSALIPRVKKDPVRKTMRIPVDALIRGTKVQVLIMTGRGHGKVKTIDLNVIKEFRVGGLDYQIDKTRKVA